MFFSAPCLLLVAPSSQFMDIQDLPWTPLILKVPHSSLKHVVGKCGHMVARIKDNNESFISISDCDANVGVIPFWTGYCEYARVVILAVSFGFCPPSCPLVIARLLALLIFQFFRPFASWYQFSSWLSSHAVQPSSSLHCAYHYSNPASIMALVRTQSRPRRFFGTDECRCFDS